MGYLEMISASCHNPFAHVCSVMANYFDSLGIIISEMTFQDLA